MVSPTICSKIFVWFWTTWLGTICSCTRKYTEMEIYKGSVSTDTFSIGYSCLLRDPGSSVRWFTTTVLMWAYEQAYTEESSWQAKSLCKWMDEAETSTHSVTEASSSVKTGCAHGELTPDLLRNPSAWRGGNRQCEQPSVYKLLAQLSTPRVDWEISGFTVRSTRDKMRNKQ